MIVFVVGMVAVFAYMMYKIFYHRSTAVPGPMALPIIGHLHLIGGTSLHTLLRDMSVKYGDIFRLKLGSRETVILSSRQVIQEAFVKQAKTFAARPNLPTFAWTRNGQTGISLCTNTNEFKVNKSIAISALHKFLGNADHVDAILRMEMNKMMRVFDSYTRDKTAFFPFHEFRRIVPSMFLSLLFSNGTNCDSTDVCDESALENVRETYSRWFAAAEADNLADYFPFLLNFPNERLESVTECVKVFEAFNISMIDRYGPQGAQESNADESNLSLFETLVEQYGKKNKAPLTREEKVRLAKMLSDMIGGGFDTGAATLSWAILYLMKHPDVLSKCRDELKRHTTNGFISTSNMKSLPYLSATLHDIHRLSSVAPLGLAHEVAKDTCLMGYKLSKGTMVLPNLWQANHDPKKWKTPEVLNPEHFLTPEGQIDVNATRQLMTFSSGVRSCPGKDISFSMSFVTLATLIHRFDFSLVEEPEDLIPARGLTLKPKKYTVKLSLVDIDVSSGA